MGKGASMTIVDVNNASENYNSSAFGFCLYKDEIPAVYKGLWFGRHTFPFGSRSYLRIA